MTVVKKQTKPQSQQQLANFERSLVADAYKRQTDKNRRESSLIISGLQPDHNIPDMSLATDLFRSEFGIQPDVATVKRIWHRQQG